MAEMAGLPGVEQQMVTVDVGAVGDDDEAVGSLGERLGCDGAVDGAGSGAGAHGGNLDVAVLLYENVVSV